MATYSIVTGGPRERTGIGFAHNAVGPSAARYGSVPPKKGVY